MDTLVISLDHLFTIEKVNTETGSLTIIPKAAGVAEKIKQLLVNGTKLKIVGNPKTLESIPEDKRSEVIRETVEKYLGLNLSQLSGLSIEISELDKVITNLQNPQDSAVIATEEAKGLSSNRDVFIYIPQAGELLGDVITVVASVSFENGRFTDNSKQILLDYLRKQIPGIEKTEVWQEVTISIKNFDITHAIYFVLPEIVKFTERLKELQYYRITVLIAA